MGVADQCCCMLQKQASSLMFYLFAGVRVLCTNKGFPEGRDVAYKKGGGYEGASLIIHGKGIHH